MQAQDNGTILLGEDAFEVRAYFEKALRCLGFTVEFAQNGEEVIDHVNSFPSGFAAVLLDLSMSNPDDVEVLREIRRIAPELPVIIVSAEGSPLNIVAAMKNGATDFLPKPVVHEDLVKSIRGAVEQRTGQKATSLPHLPAGRSKMFVGSNPRMREIQSTVERIGWSEAPVLIQGETGSGKEVLARDLHRNSPRAGKIFLKLNCAALPTELVESELFGYERGAFTGAFQKKAGMFEAADGGTIFLDEIGDMDVRLQAKLLQVLQDREFQRIGGKETIKVDVRVMAATHRDLEKAIADRTFREDLYYRLDVINFQLPPLRERREDIIPMAEYLLQKHAVPGMAVFLSAGLKQAMQAYRWPGNVRELENMVRRLVVLRNPEVIARELLAKSASKPVMAVANSSIMPETRPAATNQFSGTTILEQVTMAKQQAETEAILAALNSTRWNRKQAATLLRIDYKALLYKMKKLGVEGDEVSFSPVLSEELTPVLSACGD